jgi:hypothetical protein
VLVKYRTAIESYKDRLTPSKALKDHTARGRGNMPLDLPTALSFLSLMLHAEPLQRFLLGLDEFNRVIPSLHE